jgi:adenine-specific DNA-methyltransferase
MPLEGNHWRFHPDTLTEMDAQGLIEISKTGVPAYRKLLEDSEGVRIGTIWLDAKQLPDSEKMDYPTQKPSTVLDKIIKIASNEGDLVADFFCGSGTTGAVAEKLGRRWIMADLGRFAIHTGRKRMIENQRQLFADGKPYRAFDVYNLGRYERQWWQKERLAGADAEHRRIVLAFYRAEPLTGASSPLLHGRKDAAFV